MSSNVTLALCFGVPIALAACGTTGYVPPSTSYFSSEAPAEIVPPPHQVALISPEEEKVHAAREFDAWLSRFETASARAQYDDVAEGLEKLAGALEAAAADSTLAPSSELRDRLRAVRRIARDIRGSASALEPASDVKDALREALGAMDLLAFDRFGETRIDTRIEGFDVALNRIASRPSIGSERDHIVDAFRAARTALFRLADIPRD